MFRKIPLEDVSEDFTRRVMYQVTAEPGIYTTERDYIELWWVPVSIIGIIALYLTGASSLLVTQMMPWLELAYNKLVVLFGIIAGLFPSIKIEIQAVPVVSLIAAAIMLILFIDLPLRLQIRSNKLSGR